MNEHAEVYDIGSGYSCWEKMDGDVLRTELGYDEATGEPIVILTILRVSGAVAVSLNLNADEVDFLARALRRSK